MEARKTENGGKGQPYICIQATVIYQLPPMCRTHRARGSKRLSMRERESASKTALERESASDCG